MESAMTIADLAGSTWDSDDLYVQSGKGKFTKLAFALNVAMIMDDDAQKRYLEIWGRPWSAVPPLGEELELVESLG